MRNEVVEFLVKKVGAGNEEIVFLTGDLGFSVLEPLREKLGPQFLNVGIAESLMTTLAATFASYGKKAFTYSITPFATFRCLEQIRNDVCYHNQDVTIIGIGAGFGYGALGPTHHSVEDLAAIWSIPNIHVYNPADINEAFACFEHSWNHKGPNYLRLSKGGDGYLSKQNLQNFREHKIVEYTSGDDLTVISTGNILAEVLKAVDKNKDVSIQALSFPILKPFPDDELCDRLSSQNVLIVEELTPYGGFSGECAKSLIKNSKHKINFKTLSAQDAFSKDVGSQDFQRSISKIDSTSISNAISNF